MTNIPSSATCPWPRVLRPCSQCGSPVDGEDGGRYVVVLMPRNFYWSWRCSGCADVRADRSERAIVRASRHLGAALQ